MDNPAIVIIDTETTGKVDPEPIEIAWVAVEDLNSLQVTQKFSSRFLPKKPISFGAMATHHILPSDLVGCPPPEEFQLPDSVKIIVGHNIDYDWKAIGSPNVYRICTLAMARTIWPDLDSHALSALIYALSPNAENARKALQSAHSALADVLFTKYVLSRILKEHPVSSWRELWQFSEQCRIPRAMPFGKHRGTPISDLAPDYVRWALANLQELDLYLMQALQQRLEGAA